MADSNDNMGKMISDALADPRFGEIFGMLKSKVDSGELDLSAVASAFSSGETAASGDGVGVQSVSGGISETRENTVQKASASSGGAAMPMGISPEAVSKIPEMMELLGPLLGGSKGEKGEKGEKGRRSDMEKHEKLLYALKPYLAAGKRDAVDNILKVAKVGDVLETMIGTKKSSEQTAKDKP